MESCIDCGKVLAGIAGKLAYDYFIRREEDGTYKKENCSPFWGLFQ